MPLTTHSGGVELFCQAMRANPSVCAIYDFQRLILDYLKEVLPLDASEALLHGSIFDNTAFCLGEKQGKLVNDECNFWYNRVGYFLVSVWDKENEFLYVNGSAYMGNRTTPLQSVRSWALSAMTVE